MYTVSEQQIEYILNDIRRNGVEMEDLQLNLLDHICCIIEQDLKDGDDFESFYQKTIKQFYKKQLWEIEEETITLLIFKNYYAMKKSMIVSGTISVTALLFGSFLKIMHWPGANVMLLLGITTMCFIFLPILFFLKTKEAGETRDKLVTGTGILMGMLLCMSTLFKIMHWPGASIFWLCTSAFSIFIFIPIYFFSGIRKPETKVNTMVTTIILIGATGLLFTLTSLRPSFSIERATFLANQDLSATVRFASEQNTEHYMKREKDPTAPQNGNALLKKKSDDLNSMIEKIKLNLVNIAQEKTDSVIDYTKLYSPHYGSDMTSHYLFDNNRKPGAEISALRKSVDEFNTFVTNTYGKKSFGLINTTGTFDEKQGGTISWEELNFYNMPFGIVLRNLTQLQLDLRVIEANCIQ